MMKKIVPFFFALFLFNSKNIGQANFPPVFEIESDTVSRQEISNTYWQILEDKLGSWTIEDVVKDNLSNKFHFSTFKKPNIDTIINTFWFRYKIKNTSGHEEHIALSALTERATFFLKSNDEGWKKYSSGFLTSWEQKDGLKALNSVPITLKVNEEMTVYLRTQNKLIGLFNDFDIAIASTEAVKENYIRLIESREYKFSILELREAFFVGFLFFAAFFNMFFYLVTRERLNLFFTLFVLFLSFTRVKPIATTVLFWGNANLYDYIIISKYSWSLTWVFLFLFFRKALKINSSYPVWDKILIFLFGMFGFVSILRLVGDIFYQIKYTEVLYLIFLLLEFITLLSVFATLVLFMPKRDNFKKLVIIGALPIIFFWTILGQFLSGSIFASVVNLPEVTKWVDSYFTTLELVGIVWFVLFFTWFLFVRYNRLLKENAQQALDKERISREKELERNQLIENQKIELVKQVEERTSDLKKSLENLKSTQNQLIQKEKLASLGELTAGIAHEIQNPLNFVNNFSELSVDLVKELQDERQKTKDKRDEVLENEILNDLSSNQEKINLHGKRASSIVKGMLEHSRASTGERALTDINKLADEYLRLSYHGLRAKDKNFNADYKTELDENLPKINVVPQDVGRVLLNLFNNAFYAVNQKRIANLEGERQLSESLKLSESSEGANKIEGERNLERVLKPFQGFSPTIIVTTAHKGDHIEIKIRDNGNGIPKQNLEKIFQPFFTTKPTGQGNTGLGLSLSYDIITKGHGGELKVESEEGEGSKFTIVLPMR